MFRRNLSTKISAVAAALGAGFFIAYAGWYYDGSQPTANNLGTPIDAYSVSAQIKSGGLTVNSGGAGVGLIVSDDRSNSRNSYFTGLVGIGTNSPFEKIDLKGNLKISGLIMPFGNRGSDGQVLAGVKRQNDPQLGALARFDWQDRTRWMTLVGSPGIIPCGGSSCNPGTCSGSQGEWPTQCESLGWNTYASLCLPESGAIAPDGKNYYEVKINVCRK